MTNAHWRYSMKKHNAAAADRWGAAIAGAILFALPMAAGFYRGSLAWMDLVVALMGIGALAVAADSFTRRAG